MLPLTLAIIDAIIAHVGDQTFAVPQSAVQEVIEVDPDKLRPLEQNELMTHRGRALPMVRLARLFHLETAPRPRLHAIVVGTGLGAVGPGGRSRGRASRDRREVHRRSVDSRRRRVRGD